MFRNVFTLATVVVVLFGCAAPTPQYTLPAGMPYASIKSSIKGAFDRHDSITIYVSSPKETLQKKLFSVKKSTSSPEGYIQVPANERLVLEYFETASGGRTCQLLLEVVLEQGQSYSLVGGFEYEKGPIPLLTDTRKCRFGVTNDSSGLPVPVRQVH